MEQGNADYGERLARLRRQAGLAQRELADKLKINQALISRYESGERRMYDQMLVATAKILGVTPNDILGVKSKKPDDDAAQIPRRFLKRMRNIHLLSRRDQDLLAQMMDAFVSVSEKKRKAAEKQ